MQALEALSHAQLLELVLAQQERIAALTERVEFLEKQLNPPTGPGLASKPLPAWVKPSKPPREKTDRKKRQCAATRPRAEKPDDFVLHVPDCCPDCQRKLAGGTLHHTREVIDIPTELAKVIEHRFISRFCGVCGKRVVAQADLSDLVCGKSRIGNGLASLIAYLHITARVPLRTIQELLLAQFGVSISLGGISDLLKRMAEKAAPIVEGLLEHIRESPVVHADETGWREDGKNGYLWSFSTPDTRYYIRDKSRSSEVVKRVLGEEFDGRLVTDFYSAYSYYLGEHQRCWVHLFRDMHELKEKHPTSKSVEAFVERVRRIYDDARAFSSADPRERRKARFEFENRLMEVARPFIGQDVPQRVLAERIQRFLKELFVFVEYPDTPPSNNAAERAIRPAVTARKVSGGTRTPSGSDTVGALMTLAGTWLLRGHDVIACFRQLLAGKLQPDANPA